VENTASAGESGFVSASNRNMRMNKSGDMGCCTGKTQFVQTNCAFIHIKKTGNKQAGNFAFYQRNTSQPL
jgi:hypothetical protein